MTAEHAIAVARVSSVKQREEDQEPGLRKYADRKSYELDHVERVHGRSAFHGRHAAQILKAVEAYVRYGIATVVIFRHVDRMARMHWEDGMRFFLKLRDAGARIEFSEQEFLNGNMELLGLFLRTAHEESKVKQSRKLQGNAVKRAIGELVGRVPWGYDAVLRNGVQVGIRPNALGRKWIPVIFNEAVAGKSLIAITEMLKGVPSPQKHDVWHEATIRRLIANTTYYGSMAGNPNLKFEALVTVELHKRANAEVGSRARRGRGTTVREPALVKPYCGGCYGVKREGAPTGKSPMYRQIAFGGKYEHYYCRGHGPARHSCGAPVIAVSVLDEAVDEIMSNDARPYMVPRYIAGDDGSERRELLLQKAQTALAAGNVAEGIRLAQEAEAIPPSASQGRVELVDSGVTIGQRWASLTRDEKREELRRWTVIAYPDNVKVFGHWEVMRQAVADAE